MTVKPINVKDFTPEVKFTETPAVVKFAATWCGPCRIVSPIVENVSKDYEGRVNFFSVDADADRPVFSRYQITGVPAILLFRDGKEVKRLSGAVTREVLVAAIEETLIEE
jgi:thioredoxin 1